MVHPNSPTKHSLRHINWALFCERDGDVYNPKNYKYIISLKLETTQTNENMGLMFICLDSEIIFKKHNGLSFIPFSKRKRIWILEDFCSLYVT